MSRFVVYGPNILKRTSVIEESSGLIQDNDSKTYYDVVCNGKSSYESTIYLRQQQNNSKYRESTDSTMH